jgi:histone-lysine N-methyltransferase SETMAR
MKEDPPPTIVRRNRFTPKILFCIFFKSTDPILIRCVEGGESVDNQYYIRNCLRSVIQEIKRQRPLSGTHTIKLLCDNETPHVHQNVSDYLQSEGVTIISHPPNSPDLSACDFWLSDLIKRNLSDQTDSESLHHGIAEFIYSLDKEEYKNIFDKWIERMKLCVNNEGHYFEHLLK